MKLLPIAAVLLLFVLTVAVTMTVARECGPNDKGVRLGNMLISGC